MDKKLLPEKFIFKGKICGFLRKKTARFLFFLG
jgi:hypothetical protein